MKKGSAVAWFNILIGIFVIGLAYLIFSQVIYEYIRPTVVSGLESLNTTAKDRALDTINLLDIVWSYWPLILIFGLLLYGIIQAQRREPDEYAY